MKDTGRRKNNIKRVREEHGLTQAQLSQKTGISVANISKMENSLIPVSIDAYEKFAKALNTNPSYLVGWSKDSK